MVFLGFIQRWMVLRNIRKAERAIKNAQDSKQRSAAIILSVDAIRDAQKKRWLADDTKAKLALLESPVESSNNAVALEALEEARKLLSNVG